MPKLVHRIPSLRVHHASGQAIVTLAGKDIYLGPAGSQESRTAYDRIIAEWLVSNRTSMLPVAGTTDDQASITINEIFLSYWAFAQQHYRKHDRPTSELALIKSALKPIINTYGKQPAHSFGPLALKAYRQQLVARDMCRNVINRHVGRVKRFFKWALSNELVPSSVLTGLQAVTGLQRGRSAARDTAPIKPVPDSVVDATLPHMNPRIQAMVQLQRLTGMRPCEVVLLRGCDLDMSEAVWVFLPGSHKTEHHGRERAIYLGPQAQVVLKPWLKFDREAYLFSPHEVREEWNAKRRSERKTPMTPSHAKRCRKKSPERAPGSRYNTTSYEHAIAKACQNAFPPPAPLAKLPGERAASWKLRLTPDQMNAWRQWRKKHRWSPNRLRHNAGTFLRKRYGIDAARVILGHSSPAVTEIYAELDQAKAIEVMAEVG